MDFLESPLFTCPVILLQTVMEEVRHRSLPLYNRLKSLIKMDVKCESGPMFAAVSGSYTGDRFFSYINNAKVDAYSVFDLTAGYRFTGGSKTFDGVEVALNVPNLFDKEYISSLGTNGFNTSADNQTLMVGAPRQVFLALKKSFE